MTSASGDLIPLGQLSVRYLVDGSATKGMGLFELCVPPNSNVPPPHSHTLNDECIYVLEGILRYSVEGVSKDLSVGESMFSPRGSVHHFSNPHSGPAKALVVQTPDIGAQYFRDVSAVMNIGGPPDRAKLIGVMTRYGLVPAMPPPATVQQGAASDAPIA